jgi:hypothetical protein
MAKAIAKNRVGFHHAEAWCFHPESPMGDEQGDVRQQ